MADCYRQTAVELEAALLAPAHQCEHSLVAFESNVAMQALGYRYRNMVAMGGWG
jgi:hypothetical protein